MIVAMLFCCVVGGAYGIYVGFFERNRTKADWYRGLICAILSGLCLTVFAADSQLTPPDYRIIEVNPSRDLIKEIAVEAIDVQVKRRTQEILKRHGVRAGSTSRRNGGGESGGGGSR